MNRRQAGTIGIATVIGGFFAAIAIVNHTQWWIAVVIVAYIVAIVIGTE